MKISALIEGTARGNWAFPVGGGGGNTILSLYPDLVETPQTLKIPGKVLEFCPDQNGRTLFVSNG